MLTIFSRPGGAMANIVLPYAAFGETKQRYLLRFTTIPLKSPLMGISTSKEQFIFETPARDKRGPK